MWKHKGAGVLEVSCKTVKRLYRAALTNAVLLKLKGQLVGDQELSVAWSPTQPFLLGFVHYSPL